jgi:hypothetical protein
VPTSPKGNSFSKPVQEPPQVKVRAFRIPEATVSMISPRVITAESINFMKLKKLSEEQKLKEKSYLKKETPRNQTPLVI